MKHVSFCILRYRERNQTDTKDCIRPPNIVSLKHTIDITTQYSIMPPLLTQVARLSDGLPLVAIQTPAPGFPVSNRDQKEARDLLRKITTGYV